MSAICLVEFSSIAKGIESLDRILKETNVEVYKGGITCPSKYYYILIGDKASIKEGLVGVDCLKKEIISGISKEVLDAIKNKSSVNFENGKSIGVVVFYTLSECVKSLDQVVKNTTVSILKLVLGYKLAGKSYYVITGDTSSIEKAIQLAQEKYKLQGSTKINNPSKELVKYI